MRRRSGGFHCEDFEGLRDQSERRISKSFDCHEYTNTEDFFLDGFDYETTEESPEKTPAGSLTGGGLLAGEMKPPRRESTVKTLIVGPASSGKKSLAMKLFGDRRPVQTNPFDWVLEMAEDGERSVKHLFWIFDVCEPKYKCILATYFRLINNIVLMFDACQPGSLVALDHFLKESTGLKGCGPDKRVILMGNVRKDSQVEPPARMITNIKQVVAEEEIRELMSRHKIDRYIEVNTDALSNAAAILTLLSSECP